jgi:hypothetical protein
MGDGVSRDEHLAKRYLDMALEASRAVRACVRACVCECVCV